MGITPIQQRKKQKYFIAIFIVALLVISIIIWNGFIKKEKLDIKKIERYWSTEIRINTNILRSFILEKFLPFEKIKPFEGLWGRENPFVPFVEDIDVDID